MVYTTSKNGELRDGFWHCFTHIARLHLSTVPQHKMHLPHLDLLGVGAFAVGGPQGILHPLLHLTRLSATRCRKF